MYKLLKETLVLTHQGTPRELHRLTSGCIDVGVRNESRGLPSPKSPGPSERIQEKA